MNGTDWIGIDWGTSRLRAARMSGGQAGEMRQSDAGMGSLRADRFEAALLDLVEDWLIADKATPILACGMVGARQGWQEAPYRAVPCPPLGDAPVAVPNTDPRLAVSIVPGLRQDAPHPDVMRGEETQIAGILAHTDDFDGCICLPGTHTKWVHVSAGEVVSFQTTLSGELFSLLTTQSVLRHSLDGDGWDAAAFDAGLDETLSRPERLSARLFQLRAADLLNGQSARSGRARLSGLLLGAELAGSKPWWMGRDIAIAGSDATVPVYERALRAQGLKTRSYSASDVTWLGLQSMRQT